MNKYQKALNYLEERFAIFLDTDKAKKSYCVLEELVEKATPKKPLEVCEYDFDVYLFGKCPVCGEGCNNGMNYCDRCGQALDWSEEDE